nr:PilZ domain-containing protein [Desulfobulbaceae bacterium]
MKEAQYIEDERRRFKRFKVKQESSFVMSSEWPALGEIVDISEGGLSFGYTDTQKWPSLLAGCCMVFGSHDSCLNNIQMETVSDRAIPTDLPSDGPVARRRGIKFGELSKEQKFLLDCFIWINGITEC